MIAQVHPKKSEPHGPDGGAVIKAQNSIMERPQPSRHKSDRLEI